MPHGNHFRVGAYRGTLALELIDFKEGLVEHKSLIALIVTGIAHHGLAPPTRGLSPNGNERVMQGA